VEDGMRLIHSTWNKQCNEKYPMLLQVPMWNKQCNEKYPMLLQVPMWQETETGLVMHSSIYAFDIYIFFFGNCCVCNLCTFPEMAMSAIR
jgi:hypothetical protein